jgi:predicted dehydrogenase
MEDKKATAAGNEGHAPVRLGVIGAGWFVSRRHLPDVQRCANVTLSALCRRDDAARTRMAEHFAVAPESAFADWKRMLDEAPLDAVLIATPNSLHFEQAQAALEKGLHVLLEKPMTIRSDHARELVRLAREKKLHLGVALNPPYWAHCHRARRALARETMGPVESVSMYWSGTADYLFGKGPQPENMPGVVPPTSYRSDPELNGGGYFVDGGPHMVSELIWVTRQRIRRVTAFMDETPSDMRTTLSVEFENGAVGTLNAIGDSRYPQRRVLNIFGCAHGMVQIKNFDFETTVTRIGQEAERFKEADLVSVGTPVGNFADAIQGLARLFSPGEHGAHVVEVVEAAYSSAATGQAVTLELPDGPESALALGHDRSLH